MAHRQAVRSSPTAGRWTSKAQRFARVSSITVPDQFLMHGFSDPGVDPQGYLAIRQRRVASRRRFCQGGATFKVKGCRERPSDFHRIRPLVRQHHRGKSHRGVANRTRIARSTCTCAMDPRPTAPPRGTSPCPMSNLSATRHSSRTTRSISPIRAATRTRRCAAPIPRTREMTQSKSTRRSSDDGHPQGRYSGRRAAVPAVRAKSGAPNTHLHIFWVRRDPCEWPLVLFRPVRHLCSPRALPPGITDSVPTGCLRYPVAWKGGGPQYPP